MRNLNIATPTQTDTNEIARNIIGAAISVHRIVGMGLQENTYRACLLHEFEEMGLSYQENVEIPLFYKNKFIETGICIGLLVEGRIMVDVQTTEHIGEERMLYVLNHLKHGELNLGLILNFQTKFLKGDAIRRVVSGVITN